MRDRPVPLVVLLLLFVLSGAAGLIYEVVWARQLVLVFGNTSQAVSTILTGFFGGLAIGGAVGGRVADRVKRPLRLYGVLELIVVAVVLLTPVTFRLIGDPRELPTRVEVVVLRAAQEALTNVRRHAAASSVGVLLGYMPESVRLVVRDDGCGLDASSGEGFGLSGMRSRAAQVGGALTLSSSGGTTVELEIPA